MKRWTEHVTMNQLPPCLLQSVVLQRERGGRAEGRERGAEGREGVAEEVTLRGQEDDFEGSG